MAGLGEFGAELAEVDGDADEPDTFTFHGHEFALPARVSALPSLRFAYNAQQVAAAEQSARAAMQRARTDAQRAAASQQMAEVELTANAGLYQFLRDVLPGQWDRFEQVAAEAGSDEIEMLGVAQKIMQAVASRPTRRSSGSPAGPSPTGPTSTDGSGSPPGDSATPSGLRVVPVTERTAEPAAMTPLEAARAEIHAASLTVEELVRSGG